MIEVLYFLGPFPSEDCWDAWLVYTKNDDANPMGRSITHANIVRSAANKLAEMSWGV